MPELTTLNDVFFQTAATGQGQVASFEEVRESRVAWRPITGHQIYHRVHALARAFSDWGVQKGDRIGLLSENRWEWAVTDFAALAIGAVDVPIYPTLTVDQTAELLADSGARVVVVSTQAQYDKVTAGRARTAIERVVIMDKAGAPEAIELSALLTKAEATGERDASFDRAAYAIRPEDAATLIYTSGTTGEPKGVVLTHGNIAANLNESLAAFDIKRGDRAISFLPLSHITARHLDYAMYARGATVAYCGAFDRLPAALKAVRPTVLVAVPRVYEKVRQEVERQASLSGFKRRLLRWALRAGAKHQSEIERGERPGALGWKMYNQLVYKKIQKGFGGRVRYYIAGGAPLGLETANWFASVGLRILEGYGLTETSPVISVNTPSANRFGSVGRPLTQVSCRIAGDGELLVKGPTVFVGYWKHPAHEPESFDEEGWFHTGDIGRLDADGFLFITDRKKELLKTSGGKLIAPQPIESKLQGDSRVAQAAVVGDRHKFVSVLIAPNFGALEAWARQQGISAATRRELVAEGRVTAVYQGIVDAVNGALAQYETLKRFRVVPDEWTPDSGELTPTLKLKRRVIAEKYAGEIAAMYADENTAQS